MKDHSKKPTVVTVTISREEVETRNLSPVLASLTVLLRSSDSVRASCERVNIEFDGYDADPRELFEIVEVRSFVRRLDEKFPFWLYFLDKSETGLQAITMCFMPASLPIKERREEFPKQLNRLLAKRWFPALNHVCAYAGFDEDRVNDLTAQAIRYLSSGPAQVLH